jgi:hypothetical protein
MATPDKIDPLGAFEPEQPAATPQAPPPKPDEERESAFRAVPDELRMWLIAAVAALILLLFQFYG